MKNNYDSPIDERCLPKSDADTCHEPSDPWGGAIDPRCTPVPKDDRRSTDRASYYDENGHLVLHDEDGLIKIIPERVDY